MANHCKAYAQMGILHNDSAGDTSRRSDKAPAHLVAAPAVLTKEQLLARISAKGISIEDEESQSVLLEALGYTHVTRYVPAHIAIVGDPSFASLYRDILLDHALQGVLLARIIQFERSFKSRLASALAQEFGAYAHEERQAFKDGRVWKLFVDGSRSELIQKARKGSKYAARIASQGRRIPIWSALEFSSLGTTSKLYTNLVACDTKREVARHYGLDTSFVESWLASLSFVRNECAHGGVLYGRELEVQPRAHRLFPPVSNRRAFYHVLMLSWLLERDTADSTQCLIDDLTPILSTPSMCACVGAPVDWGHDIRETIRLSKSLLTDDSFPHGEDSTHEAVRPC